MPGRQGAGRGGRAANEGCKDAVETDSMLSCVPAPVLSVQNPLVSHHTGGGLEVAGFEGAYACMHTTHSNWPQSPSWWLICIHVHLYVNTLAAAVQSVRALIRPMEGS